MREKKIITIICILVVMIIAIISLGCGTFAATGRCDLINHIDLGRLVRSVQGDYADFLVMIDPGHGGMDGGASASDGTLEKDINLAIAGKLAVAAEAYNCSTILTRETDEWLCETEDGSIRSRKTADLMGRRELIRKYSPDIVVSIHLNSFRENPAVHGVQVFYPSMNGDTEILQQCEKLAVIIQKQMNNNLQQEEPRSAMARDGVFLFREVNCPMVIVECGFMSNSNDTEKLKTESYQQKAAQCIMEGIAEFSGLKKPEYVEIINSSE